MSLKPLSLLALFIPSVFAQSIIPLFECFDSVSQRGRSAVAAPATTGYNGISFTQPVPLGAAVTINPGGANQETVYLSRYTTSTAPYTAHLQSAPFQGNPAPLVYAHAAGEPVTFSLSAATGYFGYFNPTNSTVQETAGSTFNSFSPNPADRGQPSTFLPSVHRNQFGVPLPGPRDLTWTLTTHSTIARTAPDFACTSPSPVVHAESVTAALSATTQNIRLGTVSGGSRSGYTAAVTSPFYLNSASFFPTANSNIQFSNIHVENGVILGDITTNSGTVQRTIYFILEATDSAGRKGLSTGVVDVVGACPMTVSPSVLTTAYINTPYTANFTATGATAPITFAVEGTLPAGLALSETGQLSGTPLQTGAFPVNIRSTAGDGCFHRTAITLEVQGQLCSANVTPLTEITLGGFRQNLVTRRFQQTVTIRNSGQSSIFGPLALVTDNLSANAALATANGTTTCAAPLGRPYAIADLGPNNLLAPGATTTLTLEFTNAAPTSPITYTPRVLAGGAIR